jgi:hypothetical protein
MINFIILLLTFIFVMNLTKIHDKICMILSNLDERIIGGKNES